MDNFYNVTEDFDKFFKDIWNNFYFNNNIRCVLVGNNKLKMPLKISKISDVYQYLTDKDILIQVNEDFFDAMDDNEIKRILLEQDLAKIEYDSESGKLKLKTHDFNSNSNIMLKWTPDKVFRANQVLKELLAQM